MTTVNSNVNHMATHTCPSIDVEVEWAMHHRWAPRKAPFPLPPVSHPVVCLMLDGVAEISDAKQTWNLLPGMIFLNGASALSSYKRYYNLSPQGGEWLSFGFQATTFEQVNLLHSLQEPVAWRPSIKEHQTLELWMRHLVSEWSCSNAFTTAAPAILEDYWSQAEKAPKPHGLDCNLVSQGLGRAIFGLCWRMLISNGLIKESYQSPPLWLNHAFQHVRDQPHTTISQWAYVSGFSMPQFRRLFHQWVGMSPQQYLTQHRLKLARQLLTTTDLTVGRITDQVGFESVSHFTRLFKRDCAVSPARYRQLAKMAKL